jgi:brefeldin A-inhibited guanine nucleotide-exchange protein
MNESTLAGQSPESHLKRQSLECLVAVLRSLVSWSARGTNNHSNGPTTPDARTRNDSISLPSLPEGLSREEKSEQDLNAAMLAFDARSSNRSGSATPDISMAMSPAEDAPSRFENAKQMKTTLLEGIRKFNFKPKRVSYSSSLLPG